MACFYPSLPDIKVGDTFSWATVCPLPAGTWSATCQIRSRDTLSLMGDLTVTVGTPVGDVTPITVEAPPSLTATWQPIPAVLDIRFMDETGAVIHTQNVGIRVTRAITEATA